VKAYDKEGWYQECRRNDPTLTRVRFHQLWTAVWALAHAMGVVVDVRTASQN
jgi:hypothetical protein